MSQEASITRFQAVKSKSLGTKLLRVSDEHSGNPHPRVYPFASTVPSLPAAIRDEIIDLYAFLFCQRGLRHLGMTFEQFLLVAVVVKPGD